MEAQRGRAGLTAAPPPVQAGAIAVRVAPADGRLVFTGARGRTVLAMLPGSLGVVTATGRVRATRLIARRRAGRALRLRLATTDPRRTLAVVLSADGSGAIRVRIGVRGDRSGVTATRIAFRARRGERYLGFGERSNAVDERGRTVVDRVVDGPWQPDERGLLRALVPAAGVGGRPDDTYFPMPWLLSTSGYGVLVGEAETSAFRLDPRHTGAWSVSVAAPHLTFRVIAGPRPADVLRRLTDRVGRQPAAAPEVFGPWYQPGRGDEAAELSRMLAAHVPLSLAQTYTHYLPCGAQRGQAAATAARIRRFHAAGLAVTTYVNPMLCVSYAPVWQEAVRLGALTKRASGAPYVYDYTGSRVFTVGQFDFRVAAGRVLYARLLREALAAGYDGWMEDFGEYTPPDARGGPAEHNLYPVRYHCAARDAVAHAARAVVRFQRSGWTGAAPCATVVWGGDPTVGYGFDGLASAVREGLSLGLSGVSRWGSDIGGYFALEGRRLTPELLDRWIELGAVSGVMRNEASGLGQASAERPQPSDPAILPVWRRWARWRTRLYPYIAAADAAYRRTGLPIMRQLALVDPGDPRAVARDDEFLFGPDLLAAPVLAPGTRRRTLYLPVGRWVDLWRSARFDGRTGRIVIGRPRVLSGRRSVRVPAALDELPLLARAGTILPLIPPDVGTLTGYGRRQVRLRDRSARELLVFPRGRSSAAIGSGERAVSHESHGAWSLALHGARVRTWTVQVSLRTLAHPFRPCSVRGGAWHYTAATGVLRIRARLRRGTLSARACSRG